MASRLSAACKRFRKAKQIVQLTASMQFPTMVCSQCASYAKLDDSNALKCRATYLQSGTMLLRLARTDYRLKGKHSLLLLRISDSPNFQNRAAGSQPPDAFTANSWEFCTCENRQ